MRSTALRISTLLAISASSVGAQAVAPPRSGAFVTRLGVDTVAIERYTRTGDRLVGDLLLRNPRARIFHYVADLAPSGMIKAMTVSVRPLGSDTTAAPAMFVTTMLKDTTASVEVARAGVRDTVMSGARVFHGSAVPQIQTAPGALGVYEQLLWASKLPGTDSVVYVQLVPGRGPPPSLWLSRRGQDSVVYKSTMFGGWLEVARVDAPGRLLGLNSTATTVKTLSTRVDNLDFDAIAKAWQAIEAAKGVPGQMSVPDTVRSTIGAANIEIAYSRPLKRGRVIFGNVVPWNQVWRTGANAATQLTTTKDLMFGSTALPAGKYTLWTLPTPTGAKLIINSQTGQWGTDYDVKRDFARLDLTRTTLTQPVDEFTMAVVPQGAGGVLRLSWDTTEYSIPFTIK
jgi:hypothetical protein